jgi:hypothetical protein
MSLLRSFVVLSLVLLCGCVTMPGEHGGSSFRSDLNFLNKHHKAIVLKDKSGLGQIAVVPEMQGRIMTSTATGLDGSSYGWINHKLIASGRKKRHINPYGGEDRFWIGPEGGQFSVFFAKSVPFDFEHWFTPAPLDTEAFEVVSETERKIVFTKDMQLKNYSGTEFKLRVNREIWILEPVEVSKLLGIKLSPSVKCVAFESRNTIVNTGTVPWNNETGLLSVWILGMFVPSPETTVVIPFVKGDKKSLGPIVNDNYFGKVPGERLVVGDGVLFFRGDGKSRGKIGLSPMRAKSLLGSYDAAKRLLTIVMYNKPGGARDYVNSIWALQKYPYRGDAVNSYNAGPLAGGKEPPGPFYELETSSPAAKLGIGGRITHVHRTIHFTGSESELDVIARKLLGVGIKDIKSALP